MTVDFDWTLRVSKKARYARLQIKPYGGLEVVIPPNFPRREVAGLVARHADWAQRHLHRQARMRDAIRLPDRIELAFDNSVTAVTYAKMKARQPDLFESLTAPALIIDGNTRRDCLKQLRRWIRQRARASLPQRLDEISAKTGLGFQRVTVRSQKTRWGSCSTRGSISLNDQLLFVPSDTVDYLMIHELCHTRHLNHSARFWQLVEEHCPAYREHEDRLGQPRSWVPDWYLYDLFNPDG